MSIVFRFIIVIGLGVLASLNSLCQGYIKIEHIGIEDKPISILVITEYKNGATVYYNFDPDFQINIAISKKHFQYIKKIILKDPDLISTYVNVDFGVFSIEIYSNGKKKIFFLPELKKSLIFFIRLVKIAKKKELENNLILNLESVLNSISK